MVAERTLLDAEETHGLGRIEILHPPGTFSVTPASLISLGSICRHHARAALAHFQQTGQSPLSKWQVHLFRFRGMPPW